MHPIVIPFLNNWADTHLTLEDALAQTIPDLHVLLLQQGCREETPGLDEILRAHPSTLTHWIWDPSLPSLAAVWNRALQWAWRAGAEHCLVLNNDIRLLPETYSVLLTEQQQRDGLFVSATGVTPEQYDTYRLANQVYVMTGSFMPGPDFSCYLITRACHAQYAFDEAYLPAYLEDIDYHRRLMLGGDGQRIFGTGLPFLHLGSGTLRALEAEGLEQRTQWEEKITRGSREHHKRKWGGDANEETYLTPFADGAGEGRLDGTAKTPYLFEQERAKWASRCC